MIVHLDGSDTYEGRKKKWIEAFSSPRLKEGFDIICAVAPGAAVTSDITALDAISKMADEHKVRRVAFLVREEEHVAVAEIVKKISKQYGFETEHFTNMQEMLDWLNF